MIPCVWLVRSETTNCELVLPSTSEECDNKSNVIHPSHVFYNSDLTRFPKRMSIVLIKTIVARDVYDIRHHGLRKFETRLSHPGQTRGTYLSRK